MTEAEFEKRWKIRLHLPPVLHPYVEGTIHSWSQVAGAIVGLDRTLTALPPRGSTPCCWSMG